MDLKIWYQAVTVELYFSLIFTSLSSTNRCTFRGLGCVNRYPHFVLPSYCELAQLKLKNILEFVYAKLMVTPVSAAVSSVSRRHLRFETHGDLEVPSCSRGGFRHVQQEDRHFLQHSNMPEIIEIIIRKRFCVARWRNIL